MNNEKYERALILLKAARDLLDRQRGTPHVLDLTFETVWYDEAQCDGFCLFDDINCLLEMDDK